MINHRLVAFALLCVSPLCDALRISDTVIRARVNMFNSLDVVEVTHNDKRYSGVMAAKICGGEDTDVDWTLIMRSDDTCACECGAAECQETTCSESGYNLEENEEGVQTCVRVETEGGEVIAATDEEVTCAPGRLETKGNSAECVMPCTCPPPPAGGDTVRIVENQKDCEGCRYKVQCDGDASLVVRRGNAFCNTPAKTTEVKTNRLTMPPAKACPGGSSPVDGVCRKDPVDCPGTVMIKPQILACGPKTDEYIESMLQKIAAEQNKLSNPSPSRLSCVAACHAIFAKFSECAEQNSATQCVGRAARSGKAIQAIGGYATTDPNAPWKMLKKGSTNQLPCKDMYGSEYNFQSGWLTGVEKLESLAASQYLLLHGEYVRQPIGRLDCRHSLCKKVDHYAASQPPAGERSLGQCLEQCAQQYK